MTNEEVAHKALMFREGASSLYKKQNDMWFFELWHFLGDVADNASNPTFTPAGIMTLDQWIEREFTGYGLAIRTKSEPTVPGEPLMSMAVAKELTRRAVAEFCSLTPADGKTP